MEEKHYGEKINRALIKKAVGFSSKEVIEEYSVSDGQMVLTKKKVTKKPIPPDIGAVKILLSLYSTEELDLSKLTEEELIIERDKLLKILEEENEENTID